MLKLAMGAIAFALFSTFGILLISNSFAKLDVDLMDISTVIGKEPVALTKFSSAGTGTQTSYESTTLYYFEDLTNGDCNDIRTALEGKRRISVKSCDATSDELRISFGNAFMNIIEP